MPRVVRAAAALRDPEGQLHVVYLGSEAYSWLESEGTTELRYARREAADAIDRNCDGSP